MSFGGGGRGRVGNEEEEEEERRTYHSVRWNEGFQRRWKERARRGSARELDDAGEARAERASKFEGTKTNLRPLGVRRRSTNVFGIPVLTDIVKKAPKKKAEEGQHV